MRHSLSRLFAYLQLMRPANLVTAVSDILAGYCAGLFLMGNTTLFQGVAEDPLPLILLCGASIGLYGGGVVFNDVFDVEIDRQERPERPLPSGKVSIHGATLQGIFLLLGGISLAWSVSNTSGLLAVAVSLLALLYDKFTKDHEIAGPLTMAMCRAGNLLLGVSGIGLLPPGSAGLIFLPVLFIGSITLISQGEVHGGNRGHIRLALMGYVGVIGTCVALFWIFGGNLPEALPYLALFTLAVFPPLVRAYKSLQPGHIMKAVKAGVLSLIILNASLVAGFSGLYAGLLTLFLFPVSLLLGRFFSVS